jgi:hypothetical protein
MKASMKRVTKVIRFGFLVGLLVTEVAVVTVFWGALSFRSLTYDAHPALGAEMDGVAQDNPWLAAVAILFLGLVVLSNARLVIAVWRAFRDLRAKE